MAWRVMRWFRRSAGRHAAPRYRADAAVRACEQPPPYTLVSGILPDTLTLPAITAHEPPPCLIAAANAPSWRGDPVTVELPGRRVTAVVIAGDPGEWMDAIAEPLPPSPVPRFEKASLPEGLLAWTEQGEGLGGTVVVSTRVDSITGADAARTALRAARRNGYRVAAATPIALLRALWRTPFHAGTAAAGVTAAVATAGIATVAAGPPVVATMTRPPVAVVHHARGRRMSAAGSPARPARRSPSAVPVITSAPPVIIPMGTPSPAPSPAPDPDATPSPLVGVSGVVSPTPSLCVSLLITGVCVSV